jgi:shikimate dehydrogenase
MSREKLLAVTGNPVLHSKSPLIFNTIFHHLSMDASCIYGRIAAADAGEAMFLFNELGLIGMNVTTPFKNSIIDHLDFVDPAAEKIGGVNTVVRENNHLKGYNTDHLGVTESLKNRGIEIEGKKCVVLGAGGAGRAAVYGLVKKKGLVTIVNRTYDKAVEVARSFGCKTKKMEMLKSLLKNTDILISTLSSTIDIIPAEWLPQKRVVFDANYKKSPLSQKAETKGCTVIRGEEWLLNQAIPAYKYFLGTAPIDKDLVNCVRESLLAAPLLAEPKNIALVGFMGSGKSLVGKMLAQKMGFSFKDLDEQLEKRVGRSIPGIFKIEGEAAFRSKEKKILKEELPRHKGVVYACGGGVVLDEENREILKEHSLVTWLYSTIKTSIERIPPSTRPLLDCENPEKKARNILSHRLFSYARTADLIVSSETNANKVVEKIHEEIHKTFKN